MERQSTIRSSLNKWERNQLLTASSTSQEQVASSASPDNEATEKINPFTMESLQSNTRFRTRCKYVELKQEFDRTVCVGGGREADSGFYGRVIVTCEHAQRVKLGKISIEIVGFEEIISSTSRRNPTRRPFYFEKVDLQSKDLPPSDAVISGKADEDSCWLARKGRTAFDVKIPMTSGTNTSTKLSERGGPLPSSFWSRKFGGIRYIATTIAEVKVNNRKPITLVSQREMQVIEYSPATKVPAFPSSIPMHSLLMAFDTKTVGNWYRGRGDVTLQAEVHVPEDGMDDAVSGKCWAAGSVGFVGIEVANDSPKPIKNLYVSLIRRLKTFAVTEDGQLSPVSFSRTNVYEKVFRAMPSKGKQDGNIRVPAEGWAEDDSSTSVLGSAVPKNFVWDGVDSGDTRRFVVDMEIPLSIRSIRFGMLVDVSFCLQVAIHPTYGPKMSVEVPVLILHPASLYPSLPPLRLIQKTQSPSKNLAINELLVPSPSSPVIQTKTVSIVPEPTIALSPSRTAVQNHEHELETAGMAKESGYTLLGDDEDDDAIAPITVEKPATTLERAFGSARSISITGKEAGYHRKSRANAPAFAIKSIVANSGSNNTAPAAEKTTTDEEYRKRVQEMLTLAPSEGLNDDVSTTIDQMFRATVDTL
ncbi:hypothetical protein SmJEL517_g06017 [Synchytrium microbalum]|uniref:Arrestin C-terminal-like domain-containing protein n=1 Tax=Synchytrium microbalum TaxID=1806994 RepID=A0A507BKT5_9FUNG|nr:uncharacterized protein SmJEL517_g06017 [Synchytrium microbalum]TPX30417.1 hypothetical protein SmJEL517_g06017 [Synchytrium microbalum]